MLHDGHDFQSTIDYDNDYHYPCQQRDVFIIFGFPTVLI